MKTSTIAIASRPARTAASQEAGQHIPVLDGIRGIAVLMILLGHFYQKQLISENYPIATLVLGRILAPAGYGVELFFVLSGFLITGILLDTKGQEGFFGKFYMRRFLRIFPLYYGALAAVFLVLPHVVQFDAGGREIAAHQVWLWTYLANWPSAYIWDNSNQFLLGHFWSLSVEEHFYLLWPALVFFLSRRGLAWACLTFLAVGILSRAAGVWLGESGPLVLQWTTLTRIDGLGVGAMLALALRTPQFLSRLPHGRQLTRSLFISLTLFLCLVLMPRRVHSLLIPAFGETIVVIFFGLGLLAAVWAGPGALPSRMLSSPWLVAFGKYSYGIYVIHGILRPAFARVFPLENVPQHYGMPFLFLGAYYLFAISLSFGLAFISYQLVEKRFLALKRYFTYRSNRSVAGSRSTALAVSRQRTSSCRPSDAGPVEQVRAALPIPPP